MINKTVCVIGPDSSVKQVFAENGWELCREIKDAEFICLTGGADINPDLYGQVPHRTTQWIERRDKYEVEAYKEARRLGKKVLGICRGAQLMNALEGGSMYQHVNHHYGNHLVYDRFTQETRTINSIHHQMMIPAENAIVVAVATGQSDQRELVLEDSRGNHVVRADLGVHDDPEVLVHYDCDTGGKYIFGLGFQGHPEYGHPESTAYFFELIDKWLTY